MMRLEHAESMLSRDIWLVVQRDPRRSSPVIDFVAAAIAATPGLGLGTEVAQQRK